MNVSNSYWLKLELTQSVRLQQAILRPPFMQFETELYEADGGDRQAKPRAVTQSKCLEGRFSVRSFSHPLRQNHIALVGAARAIVQVFRIFRIAVERIETVHMLCSIRSSEMKLGIAVILTMDFSPYRHSGAGRNPAKKYAAKRTKS
jgi:hypothetical protein